MSAMLAKAHSWKRTTWRCWAKQSNVTNATIGDSLAKTKSRSVVAAKAAAGVTFAKLVAGTLTIIVVSVGAAMIAATANSVRTAPTWSTAPTATDATTVAPATPTKTAATPGMPSRPNSARDSIALAWWEWSGNTIAAIAERSNAGLGVGGAVAIAMVLAEAKLSLRP